MSLTWDEPGSHLFETGISRAVFYPVDSSGAYGAGIAWNGIYDIRESPSGADPSPIFANGAKLIDVLSLEEYKGTIEAYTYPDAFAECDGSATVAQGVKITQQVRKRFALCYRTEVGNDADGPSHGYKIHIIYGVQVSPTERQYDTINDSPDAVQLSWNFSTVPVRVTGYKPTSYLVIDSLTSDATKLAALEGILYGPDGGPARLLLPSEIIDLMGEPDDPGGDDDDDTYITGTFPVLDQRRY